MAPSTSCLREFETIPGVSEDTIELLNNLKQLRLQLPDDEEQATYLCTSSPVPPISTGST